MPKQGNFLISTAFDVMATSASGAGSPVIGHETRAPTDKAGRLRAASRGQKASGPAPTPPIADAERPPPTLLRKTDP